MALSHSSCAHPSTSAARAACRKAQAAGPNPAARKSRTQGDGNDYANYAKAKQQSKATRAKRETEASETAAEIISKAEKKAHANAVRTAAAQAKNPRKSRRECYLCGKPAAHAEIKSGEPVCLKHIADVPGGWDNIKVLPL